MSLRSQRSRSSCSTVCCASPILNLLFYAHCTRPAVPWPSPGTRKRNRYVPLHVARRQGLPRLSSGDLDSAQALLEESLTLSREHGLGHGSHVASILTHLAGVAAA